MINFFSFFFFHSVVFVICLLYCYQLWWIKMYINSPIPVDVEESSLQFLPQNYLSTAALTRSNLRIETFLYKISGLSRRHDGSHHERCVLVWAKSPILDRHIRPQVPHCPVHCQWFKVGWWYVANGEFSSGCPCTAWSAHHGQDTALLESLYHSRQCSIVFKPRSDGIDVVCLVSHDCSRKLRIYTVSQKKRHPFYICHNLVRCHPIYQTLGRNIPHESCNKHSCTAHHTSFHMFVLYLVKSSNDFYGIQYAYSVKYEVSTEKSNCHIR